MSNAESYKSFVDQPGTQRDEERLDEAALAAYLGDAIPTFQGPLTVRQFRSGHSNLTYLVGDGRSEWVLRRPPFGSVVKTAHDMGREFRILSRLHRVYPMAPRAFLYCDDASVLGAPFYLMDRVEGIVLRTKLPKTLVVDETIIRRLNEALVDNLAAIHAIDLDQADLADLGKPEGYIERQVVGWAKRYADSRTDDIAEFERVSEWLHDKLPDAHDGVLIHNDYKHDNLVLDPNDLGRIIGVLDWEMATIGHPLMDLGTTLSYWVEATDSPQSQVMRFLPTHLPGTMTRAEVIDRYAAQTGRDLSGFDFYRVYGLFKTAGVAQQIYYRYKIGKTSDPRFEMMIYAVQILLAEAARVVDSSKL